MPAITSANFAQSVVKLFASQALPALSANLVMGGIVNREYDDNPGSVGDTVNIAVPPTNMVANDLAEGGSVQLQDPNLGHVAIVVNRHKEASFQIPDMSKVLTNLDLLKTYLDPAVIQVAQAIESDLLGLYSGLTANPAVGAAGVGLTEAVVDAAETALFNAKVPPSQTRYFGMSATAYSQVRTIPRFTEFAKIANPDAIVNGELGTIKGVYPFRSQLIQPVSGTTNNIMFTKDAFCVVSRRMPTPPPGLGVVTAPISLGNFAMRLVYTYSGTNLAEQFTVEALYGVAVLRPEFGIPVLS